jgi:hypothetical protein
MPATKSAKKRIGTMGDVFNGKADKTNDGKVKSDIKRVNIGGTKENPVYRYGTKPPKKKGTKMEVWYGLALETAGGLKKSSIKKKSVAGKNSYVSAAKSTTAKKNQPPHLKLWSDALTRVRESDSKFEGLKPLKKDSPQDKKRKKEGKFDIKKDKLRYSMYDKAKKIYEKSLKDLD